METARVWKFGDDVDTDQIIASQYIILPSIDEMKAHTFESLDAGFAAAVAPGDVVVAGMNFGCGSSREQAPAVLKALGVRAVVAGSFARIFYRNAINIGLPVIVCAALADAVHTGDAVEVDLEGGQLAFAGQSFACTKLPQHMQDILAAGGLLASLKAKKAEKAAPAGQAINDGAGAGAAMPPQTMAEKIIAAAAGKPFVHAGEIHTLALDQMMSNDGTTHLTIDMYNEVLGAPGVADPGRVVFVIDHNSPADTPKTAEAHRKMRTFAQKEGIAFYEGKGVCHQLMMEHHVRPGEFIIGADSHTCSYGALGAFGTGVGGTDFLYALVTGETWVMVPETARFHLDGTLPTGVTPRDVMLAIIGDVGADGCNYQVMEFVGEGVRAMSVEERMVLANLAVEAGAKAALMEPDDKVLAYLRAHGSRTPKALYKSDEGARFITERHYDLSAMVPVVARPDHIDDVVPAAEALGVKIDEAFLGSCNNGRLGELRAAARLLKGRRVHPMVRFIVSPASAAVYQQALEEGLIAVLNEAGAQVVNANCSVCWGSCQGVLGPGEVLISTGTRNFKGRAGHPDSKVYLGSAETVTASAIKGEIATAAQL
ncbi:MAG: aconitase/3-isopropylmalate dehydratase large subunit family protein [Oscillospiraceae bacterium]